MKRQKDITLKDTLLGQYVSSMLLEKSKEIAPEGMNRLSQIRNNIQLWMCLVVKVKFDAIKNNIA